MIGGPMDYGTVQRDDNTLDDGTGIGGGIGGGAAPDRVTFYVQVPDIRASLARAENSGEGAPPSPTRSRERAS